MASLSTTFILVFLNFCIAIKCNEEDHFLYHAHLDADAIQIVLTKHNEKRRIPSASNMKILKWDESLVKQAEDFVRNCSFDHPDELNDFGENIHLGDFRLSELYSIAVDAWYDEVEYFDSSTMMCQTGKVCGHYTQVVWAESERIGCSTARCREFEGTIGAGFLTSCRYFPGGNSYMGGVALPSYKVGEACTACEEGWTECNNGLCDTEPQQTTEEHTTTSQTTPDTVIMTTTDTYLSSEAVSTEQSITVPDSFSTTSFTDETTTDDAKRNATTPYSFVTNPIIDTTTDDMEQTATTSDSLTTTPVIDRTTAVPTDSTPASTCSAEYQKLLNEYRESLNDWKKVFQKYVKQNEC